MISSMKATQFALATVLIFSIAQQAMASSWLQSPESRRSSHLKYDETICYIPGAGGGSDWIFETVPPEVQARGIPMIAFDVGDSHTVQWHAQKFVDLLEKEVQKNPNFRCHITAYSMGGLIMRYAANHLFVNHPTLGRIKASDLMLTMTTMSTPHEGTPLPLIFKRVFGRDLDQSRMQMDETAVVVFNDPKSPDYSPIIAGKPSFSYRTFINGASEAHSYPERFGYLAIQNDYKKRGIQELRNDGIVPYRSMAYGTVVGDVHASHSFWNVDIGVHPTLIDWFETHWQYIHGAFRKSDDSPFLAFLNAIVPTYQEPTDADALWN